ncbi:MAG TPA: LysM domain-containing protein [Blastocatellia bacterium]
MLTSLQTAGLAIRGLLYNVDDGTLKEAKWHLVEDLESWARVADQYYIKEEVLKAANPQADHSELKSGQVLYIPTVES